MSLQAPGVPSLKQFMDLTEPDLLALSRGEATRFQTQCDGYLATLSDEKNPPTAEDVQRVAVRLTWAFFYARKGSPKEEHERLLGVHLHALEKLHDTWLDVEKPKLVERVIVRESAKPAREKTQADAGDGMPRPPEIVMKATRWTDV